MTEYLSKKIRILSFAAIIMVVLLHSYNLDTLFGGQPLVVEKNFNWFIQHFFSNGITRIAVPLFFIISGFLFFFKFEPTVTDYSQKVSKRFKTLFVPYVLWSLLGIALYFLLQSVPQSAAFFSNGLIRDYTFLQLFDRSFLHPIPYQLWFIRDLMLFVVGAPLVFFTIKYTRGIILLPLALTWLIDLEYVILSNEALLFFFVGAYIAIINKKIIAIDFADKAIYLVILWIILVVSKVSLAFFGNEEQLATLIVYRLSVVIGLLAVWSFYDFTLRNKNPKVYAIFKLSFFIFAIHEPMLTIIKKVLFALLGTNEMSCLIIYVLAPVIALAVAITLGILLKRNFTGIYKITTGDR